MKCPCCKSDDTSGSMTARISVICWDCKAIFKQVPGGAIQVDECNCGRHNEGQVIKRAEREIAHEEVTEHGDV